MSLSRIPDRWLELDDCALPYWQIGQGPDVILIHGWPLDARTWREIVPAWADRFTCHLIDLPGAGQSRWDGHTATGVRAQAEALRQAIEALGLRRYALVGHDSGGAFARMQAAIRPDEVWAVVVGDSEIPHRHSLLLKALVASVKIPGRRALMRGMLGSKLLRRLPMALGGCFTDMATVDAGFGALFIEPLLTSDEAFAGQLILGADFDLAALDELAVAHSQITAPTLLIWGAQDPWFPLKDAQAMLGQFGGAVQMAVLDPGKLFVHEERPADWAALVGDFLDQHA